jgi:hypothetical protein
VRTEREVAIPHQRVHGQIEMGVDDKHRYSFAGNQLPAIGFWVSG